MRVELQRGGGLAAAATRRSVTVDSETLPADAAAQLRDLVRAADLPGLAGQAPAPRRRPRPDSFYYRLVVEDGGQRYSVEAEDPDLPQSVRPLIDWLMNR